jgi:glycosyltransferase involved in cell wall biosynthesis
MNATYTKMKLALLVNIIAPSRVALFAGLAEHFDLLILHGGMEANRDSWGDLDKKLPNASVKRAWGWQLRIAKRVKGKFYDHRFLHITPGYIWHLLKFRPDILIANEMGFRTIVALGFGIIFRKPVWVWWGGTFHTERNVSTLKRLLRKAISRVAKHWISYGKSSTEYLSGLGIRPDRILEIQNSVDERLFASQQKAAYQLEPRPVLLHVGQLILRKGIDAFLRAAAAVQRAGNRFSVLFVGNGPEKKNLEQMVKELNLENVNFRGAVPPAEMPSVYRSADLLIFPTLEDPWGLVANEAILTGLPVLCSKYAGCAKELFAAENIFDPLNEDEFTRKLSVAVAGQLPFTNPTCLKTTNQLVDSLVEALNRSVHSSPGHSADMMVQRAD